MLLTSGAIALSRKVADEKAKRREAKQGHLTVGDRDVAKRAFASQTSNIGRTGTTIKHEDPNDLNVEDLDSSTEPNIYSPRPEVQDARRTSNLDVTSPVQSEKGFLGVASPQAETTDNDPSRAPSSYSQNPPSYAATRTTSTTASISPSVYSREADNISTQATSETRSIASGSTNSTGSHAIRVKSRGTDLTSGFPYHPALFDLHIAPDKWESFTSQVVDSSKISGGDRAKMFGAATATAMVGAIGTSVYIGKSMKRSFQEKKVRSGLQDMSEEGLGSVLCLWNEGYFNKQGLFVHLELSESASKNPDGKSRTFRKPALMYSKGETREKKRDERKFVIVVTKLDEDGNPTEALNELAAAEEIAELQGSSDEPSFTVPELPGEDGTLPAELPGEDNPRPVELPADTPTDLKKPAVVLPGYAEMDGDNSHLLDKMHLEDHAPHR